MVIFNYVIPSTFISWTFTVRQSSHLFIYFWVSMDSEILHSIDYNHFLPLLLLFFNASTVPPEPSGSPFTLALVPFTCLHHFFEHFLTFCHQKLFQAHLVLPCPSPGISHWFLLGRMAFIKQDLVHTCAHCYSALLADRTGKYCVCTRAPTHVHIDSHLYLFLYLAIYIYLKPVHSH